MKRNKIILTFSIVAVLALAFFVQTLVGADAVRVVASVIANDGTDVVRDGDSYQFSTRRGEYETVSFEYKITDEGTGNKRFGVAVIDGFDWSTFYGYFWFCSTGSKYGDSGVTTKILEDGFIKATIILAETDIKSGSGELPENTSILYIHDAYIDQGLSVSIRNIEFGYLPVLSMVKGAAVRVVEPYGIRFRANVPADLAEDESVTYGMTIIPFDWIKKYSLSGDYLTALDLAGLSYRVFDCNINEGDEGYYIQASLTNIKENNIEREFIGIAWFEKNGVKTYSYDESCVRSIKKVATKALILEEEDQYDDGERDFLLKSAKAFTYNGTADLDINTFNAERGEVIRLYYRRRTAGDISFAVKNSDNDNDYYGEFKNNNDSSLFSGIKIESEGLWNKLTVKPAGLDVINGDPSAVTEFNSILFDQADNTATFDVIGVSVLEKESVTILFQGDSITDNGRSRSDLTDLGGGYAAMVAKALKSSYGDEIDFTFINRGNSGWNLIENWNMGGVDHYQEQFYQYNADVATIFIGYNDIMNSGQDGGVSDEDFRSCYRALLQGLKERGTIAVCIAPYDVTQRIKYTITEFAAKKAIIKSLAEEFGFPFVDVWPYMENALSEGAYEMELCGDLTHPWAAGCGIIAELVTDTLSKLLDGEYTSPLDLGAYRPITTVADNEEDLTNSRIFIATTHGKAEYDTETFYSTEDFVSTKSLKITHDNDNPVQDYNVNSTPEQANSFSRVLFDLTDKNGISLTAGKLSFDVKTENFAPWIAVQVYGSLVSFGSNKTGQRVIKLSQSFSLGNGWYRIEIDLAAWKAEDSSGALNSAAAIVITASKGVNDAERTQYGICGDQNSYMWIDNLRIKAPDSSIGADPWADDCYND